MKELSIEEKAKAYDDAIKKAEALYKAAEPMSGCNVLLETVFPELKESGGERIRKELINYFIKGKEYLSLCSFSKEEILAWLEKQGEPQIRTGIEWVNIMDDACDNRYAEEYAHGEYCHEQSFRWGFQEGVDWLEKQGEKSIGVLDEEEREFADNIDSFRKEIDDSYQKGYNEGVRVTLEKQGEQKSYGQRQECADCQFNYAGECKGSCVIKKDECEEILEDATIDGNEDGLIAATIKYKNEQNPAWSEDDENMLRRVFDSLNTYAKGAYPILKSIVEEEIDWLKSLKNRVIPKQKWSEEDDNCLSTIIAEFSKCAGKSVSKDEWMRCNDFLNSIRDRVQSPPKQKWSVFKV